MTRFKLLHVHQYRDRHGKLRRYVRRPGCPSVALPGLPGSAEFMAAYAAAIASVPVKPSRFAPGTLAHLVTRFYGSTEFANLKPSSQKLYRRVLEPVAAKDGHRMVRDMPQDKARKVIEEIGVKRPGMANLTRSVLRRLFAYAISINECTGNPFDAVPIYLIGTHHTWTEAQLEQFETYYARGARERLLYDVLLYTLQRVGDVVRLRRDEIKTGVWTLTQQKTGVELSIDIHPALADTIKATPAKGVFLIGDADGRPMTANAASLAMAAAIEAACLPAECVAHGLRKAGMRRLAEHGSTAHQIGAVSGHKTLKEIERYTAKANQKTMASAAIRTLPHGKRTRPR